MTSIRPGRFSDHFSGVAPQYATFRPRYPSALFAWLAELASRRRLAWDCAAGSGQATLDLVERFDRVVATDASAAQLAAAPPHPRIEYRVSRAESTTLKGASVDLAIVAQALHWLEPDRFYAEARRVLTPGGILAAWSYGLHTIDRGAIDAVLERFYRETVGPYWLPERRLVETGYRTVPFPFEEIPAPRFEMAAVWSLPQLLGYIGTWSATTRYMEARGDDPVSMLARQVGPLWGPAERTRSVTWPLSLRAGRAR